MASFDVWTGALLSHWSLTAYFLARLSVHKIKIFLFFYRQTRSLQKYGYTEHPHLRSHPSYRKEYYVYEIITTFTTQLDHTHRGTVFFLKKGNNSNQFNTTIFLSTERTVPLSLWGLKENVAQETRDLIDSILERRFLLFHPQTFRKLSSYGEGCKRSPL